MRVLVIGGTGFIGTYLVRQLADQGHVVAIYHRGRTQAVLPNHVHQILHPRSAMPIQKFPKKLFEFGPDVVVHTLAMGAADAEAAVDPLHRGAALLVVQCVKSHSEAIEEPRGISICVHLNPPFTILEGANIY